MKRIFAIALLTGFAAPCSVTFAEERLPAAATELVEEKAAEVHDTLQGLLGDRYLKFLELGLMDTDDITSIYDYRRDSEEDLDEVTEVDSARAAPHSPDATPALKSVQFADLYVSTPDDEALGAAALITKAAPADAAPLAAPPPRGPQVYLPVYEQVRGASSLSSSPPPAALSARGPRSDRSVVVSSTSVGRRTVPTRLHPWLPGNGQARASQVTTGLLSSISAVGAALDAGEYVD